MRLAAFAFVLASLAPAAGCAPAPPLYTAETAPVVVDGDAGEWPAALRPVPSEGGLTLGLRTSDDALFVVVVAGDERQIRRVSSGGLRVWLDPAGGTERVLAVGYPVPLDRAVARGGTAERRRFEDRLGRISVQRGEGPVQTFELGNVEGVEAASEWGARTLVTEVRIPFGDGPVAVERGEALGVGIELVEAGRSGLRARRAAPPRQRGADADAADDGPPTITRWLRLEL